MFLLGEGGLGKQRVDFVGLLIGWQVIVAGLGLCLLIVEWWG